MMVKSSEDFCLFIRSQFQAIIIIIIIIILKSEKANDQQNKIYNHLRRLIRKCSKRKIPLFSTTTKNMVKFASQLLN